MTRARWHNMAILAGLQTVSQSQTFLVTLYSTPISLYRLKRDIDVTALQVGQRCPSCLIDSQSQTFLVTLFSTPISFYVVIY
jgi:hypothetical protein